MRHTLTLNPLAAATVLLAAFAGAGIAAQTLPAADVAATGAVDAVAVADTTRAASADLAAADADRSTAADALAISAVAAPSTSTSSAAAAGGPVTDADAAGSTEVAIVQRSCGAPADSHYEPPSGQGQASCIDSTGAFDPNREYTARHFTNNVSCGTEKEIAPGSEASGVYLNGDGSATQDGGGGWLQACSQDGPVQGRVTLAGTVTSPANNLSGALITVTTDGDQDNAEQARNWREVNLKVGEATGTTWRCGKKYESGGRGDSTNPTDEDVGENCVGS